MDNTMAQVRRSSRDREEERREGRLREEGGSLTKAEVEVRMRRKGEGGEQAVVEEDAERVEECGWIIQYRRRRLQEPPSTCPQRGCRY